MDDRFPVPPIVNTNRKYENEDTGIAKLNAWGTFCTQTIFERDSMEVQFVPSTDPSNIHDVGRYRAFTTL